MKQNLRRKAFVPFCVFSGQTLITCAYPRKSPPQKVSSQDATNLAYSSADTTGWYSFCASLVLGVIFLLTHPGEFLAQWVRKNFFSVGRKRSDAPMIGRSVVIICMQTTMKITLQNLR